MAVIAITGASRGIGAAVAEALQAEHELVLIARDCAALDAVAAQCRRARTVELDVSSPEAVVEAAAKPEQLGITYLDGLVHCAGIAELGRIENASAEQWRSAFEVNVLGVVTLTAALLPALRAASGHVVAINSGAGHAAKARWGAYSASKFALRAFTDTLRAEEPLLRVTSIHPGRVDTDMQRGIVAAEGGEYEPAKYLARASVATAVQQALESSSEAHPTEVILRPRGR